MKRLFICIVALLIINIYATAQNKSKTDGSLGGRTFVYGQDVRLARPLSIDPSDTRPLSQILDEQLKDTGITYQITKAHILLFAPQPETPKPEIKHYTIYGYVIDKDSKESLIGANVYVPIVMQGTGTNDYGHFSITLPEGDFLLETTYVGYGKDSRNIVLTKDTLITIELKINETLAEVVVESDRPETGVTSSRAGAITVPVQQIMRTPAILGEADVIKALHLQPGVQQGMAGQVSMSVRGGNIDQNLFLLDGMMLYNVDHVMGFESAFMPDAVKHVDFYRGSFSSRYGGRLSSVTDVRTKDGDMQQYHGTFSVGLLASHLSVEGPIKKDRTSFIVSARRTYADWLINAFKKPLDIDIDRLSIYFGDINAKINHKISDTDRLFLSFYWGRDVMAIRDNRKDEYEGYFSRNIAEQDLHWGNTLYHLRWNHIFSPKLFANVTVGYNQFNLNNTAESESTSFAGTTLIEKQKVNLGFTSGIDDLSSTIDFDYHPMPAHHIRFGAQYTLHEFKPEVQSSRLLSVTASTNTTNENFRGNNDVINAHESALYAEDDMNLGQNWQLNAGLRAVLFTTDGKSFPSLEPRLSLSRILPYGLRAKASYSMMHQYVHKLASSLIASPSDLWVPVTKNMRPMSANQFTLGLFSDYLPGWEFGIDTYWKEMNNVVDYIDGASFFGNTKGWESKISSGHGRAYGVELSAAKTTGKTTGMLNYTLGKSDRWFPDGAINSGRHFPYRFDRRHVVHFLIQHQLTKRIDINASWNFASGAMTSLAKQQSFYIEPKIESTEVDSWTSTHQATMKPIQLDYYSSRNNYRLEPTHQLDLGINIHKQKKHGERIWNFSLMNAYRHLNQDMLYTTQKTEVKEIGTNPDGSPVYETTHRSILRKFTLIPILPSFTYTYKF